MLARTTTPRPPSRARATASLRPRSLAHRSLAHRSVRQRAAQHLRAGFTLIEILVVIIVISILLALLVPALTGAKTKVNEARVLTEIKQLEGAIGAFKAKYGVDPPSRFVIYLTETGWNTNAPAKAFVRRIWPQFDFKMPSGSYPAGQSPTTPNWSVAPIVKTDGSGNQYVGFNSGEALMFFLGGIQDTNNAPMGFSKNPAMPFSPNGTNREGPFMEFDVGRIKDSDQNGVPEYVDPLPNQQLPYLYFSSYEGKRYRRTELPQNATNTAYTLIHDFYRVYTGTGTPPAPPSAPPSPGPGVDLDAGTNGTSSALPPQKPQTFQIISPGLDGEYGLGGAFNPSLPNGALADKRDYDNLTNFNGGRLVN